MTAYTDVLAAAQARAEALAGGDAARLQELLHPDFHWSSHTGEAFDRTAYLEANTGGRTTWQRQDLGEPEVSVVAEAAVLITIVTDTIDTVAGQETYRMPMTQTWIHADSGWQVSGWSRWAAAGAVALLTVDGSPVGHRPDTPSAGGEL